MGKETPTNPLPVAIASKNFAIKSPKIPLKASLIVGFTSFNSPVFVISIPSKISFLEVPLFEFIYSADK